MFRSPRSYRSNQLMQQLQLRIHLLASVLRQSDGAPVPRSLRRACLAWSDTHGVKDSVPSGVAGAQSRHEIPSAFVAQSLLSASPSARLARRRARSSGPGACV